MAMIEFVRNYTDHSTDRGYQFQFRCDQCSNGYMSSYEASMIGTAGGLLQAAGSFSAAFSAAPATPASRYSVRSAARARSRPPESRCRGEGEVSSLPALRQMGLRRDLLERASSAMRRL